MYNGSVYYFRKNVLGDVTEIYDPSGAIVTRYFYDAWGNWTITYNSTGFGTINPFRYRGYYWDNETGFYYLQSRYYDPEIRRFINADDLEIIPELAGTVGGLNLYAYCNDNPITFIDPDGYILIVDDIAFGLICLGIIAVALIATMVIYEAQTHTIGNALEDAFSNLTWGSGSTPSITNSPPEVTNVSNWWGSMWEPGTWPGNDPTVSPGDGFVWRPGGLEGGDWYNPLTGDQLHPELGHPLPKGPHWNWRNKLKAWLRKKGFDIWPPGGEPPTPA